MWQDPRVHTHVHTYASYHVRTHQLGYRVLRAATDHDRVLVTAALLLPGPVSNELVIDRRQT